MKSAFLLGLAAVSQVVDALRPTMFQYQQRMRTQLALRNLNEFSNDLASELSGQLSILGNIGIAADNISDVSALTMDVPLDHFGYDQSKTFKNRYWVYSKAWKPGNPVFIYDGGEGDAGPWAARMLTKNTSFFNQLIHEHNGIGIVWEHRYYGTSTPVNISTSTDPEDMKYLTVDQALADVPLLAKNFKLDELKDYDLTPNGVPWVFVGGSYPGTRAAFMRLKYPDVIYASWASSAPVEARIDMGVYFEQVARGLNKWGFGNCTKNILAAVNYIDGELGAPYKDRQDAVKRLLLGPGSEKNPNGGIADALSMIFYNWQSYGLDGGVPSLRNFCDWISTDETGKVAPAQGWKGIKQGKWIAQRWASWKDWITTVNTFGQTNCAGSVTNATAPAPANVTCDLTTISDDPDSISWTWQYCTQWGFFQQANFGPNRIISRYNTLDHQQDYCNRAFPAALKNGLLPRKPQVNQIVGEFKGWAGRPSNTMFTEGEFDPWRTMSELSVESFAPHYRISQDIPECNQKTDANTVFGYILPDGCHCYDMDLTFKNGDLPRKLFSDSLRKWLKCWKPKGSGGYGYGYGRSHHGRIGVKVSI